MIPIIEVKHERTGYLITQQACDSLLDWTHGMTYEIKRIFVPDSNNLVITPHNKQVYALIGFEG
ncbi:MAG: hypothetical protein JSW07_20070 [bacterium]|nr:MAG: hypothetical protein JSW07_20070 [bacterium]